MISEDWSSDCRRDVPWLARLAEAGGLELRIFNRDGRKVLGTRRPDPAAAPDGNHDMMLEFLNAKNGAEWASVPVVVVYTKDLQELHRYMEYPAIYHKDPVRAHQQAARGGETAEQGRDRGDAGVRGHAGRPVLRPLGGRVRGRDPDRALREADPRDHVSRLSGRSAGLWVSGELATIGS